MSAAPRQAARGPIVGSRQPHLWRSYVEEWALKLSHVCCCIVGHALHGLQGPPHKHCRLPEPRKLPQTLPPWHRYVGASEENIRNLFKDAEADYMKLGEASGACLLCG